MFTRVGSFGLAMVLSLSGACTPSAEAPAVDAGRDAAGGSGGTDAAVSGNGGTSGSGGASTGGSGGGGTGAVDAGVTDLAVADVATVADTSASGGPSALWAGLRNPIYARDGWSVKDVAMVLVGDTYRFYFSAFFADGGRERCHVATTSTTDLKTFAPATILFDGKDGGWLGMCSPDVQRIGEQYVMTFNSWGDLAGKPNQLFYATSPDLGTWSAARPLGAALTGGRRAIDAAIGNDNGRMFLFWKERIAADRTRLAMATALDGPWRFVGEGYPTLLAASGRDNGLIHENFQFMRIEGKWHLLSTDYMPHEPWVYTMTGAGTAEADWLSWQNGASVQVARETFNTDHQANSAYLADWRTRDGWFYLVYAGRTEGVSHEARGDNKLGLSRSKDLKTWSAAGR